MLDVFQPNWAAQLSTATITRNNLRVDFLLPDSFILRRVDWYLFFCPTQNIPNQGVLSIRIYISILFPRGIKGLLLGTVSLSGEEQSCAKLIQISIPTNPTSVLSILYLIEFSTIIFLEE